mgnify:CR=1 FL=1
MGWNGDDCCCIWFDWEIEYEGNTGVDDWLFDAVSGLFVEINDEKFVDKVDELDDDGRYDEEKGAITSDCAEAEAEEEQEEDDDDEEDDEEDDEDEDAGDDDPISDVCEFLLYTLHNEKSKGW